MNITSSRGDLQLHPRLHELAARWPVREDWLPILRCGLPDCGDVIYASDGVDDVVEAHMIRAHGYRMNGRRYDNDNRELPDEPV